MMQIYRRTHPVRLSMCSVDITLKAYMKNLCGRTPVRPHILLMPSVNIYGVYAHASWSNAIGLIFMSLHYKDMYGVFEVGRYGRCT